MQETPPNKDKKDFVETTVRDLSFESELRTLPALEKGKDLWQNNFHEFDVYDHTMKFVEFIKSIYIDNGEEFDPDIIAASYLHDIGKPVVAFEKIRDGVLLEKEPGKPYHEFTNHEVEGEKMVREMPGDFFNRYNLNQEKIAKLVGAHFIPMKTIKLMRKTTNFSEFVDMYHQLEKDLDATGLSRDEVMMMFLADSYSKGKGCTDLEELMKAREVILSGGTEEELRELYQMQKDSYGKKE